MNPGSKMRGVLSKEFFAGEVLVFLSQDGRRFEVTEVSAPLIMNREVEITAEPDLSQGGFGFNMIGERIKLTGLSEV